MPQGKYKDFEAFYNAEIEPLLTTKNKYKKWFVMSNVFTLFALSLFFYLRIYATENDLWFVILFFICLFVILPIISFKLKRQEKAVSLKKLKVMEKLASFWGLVYGVKPRFITEKDYSALTVHGIISKPSIDNTFYGEKDGISFEIAEVGFYEEDNRARKFNWRHVSTRYIAVFPFKKKLEGETLLLRDSVKSKISQGFVSNMERIKLEWPDFEEVFDLYSTCQREARYIFDTHIMETVYDFCRANSAFDIKMRFKDKKLFVFVDDMTSVGKESFVWDIKPGTAANTQPIFYKLLTYCDNINFFLKIPAALKMREGLLFEGDTMADRKKEAEKNLQRKIAELSDAKKPQPVPPDTNGIAPVFLAIIAGNAALTAQEISAPGFNINAGLPLNGNTPLHVAVWNNNAEITKLLLAAPDIDRERINMQGETPMAMAKRLGFDNLVVLLENGITKAEK